MTQKKSFFEEPNNEQLISWKSLSLLKRYTTRFGEIKPRKYTWNAVKHQKQVRKAIIRARELWLLSYIK